MPLICPLLLLLGESARGATTRGLCYATACGPTRHKMGDTDGDLGSAFIKLEDKFGSKFGATSKLACCGKEISLRLGCQIIAVAVVVDALMKFGSTFARWGAPCFHWQAYIATVVTFLGGHLVRLVGLPLGVWVILSLKKGENVEKATSFLFHFLLALAAVCVIDLFVCLFEVHDVCGGPVLASWNECSHAWGIQAHVCEAKNKLLPASVTTCATAQGQLKHDDAAVDKVACESAGDAAQCTFAAIKKELRVKPSCCDHDMWADKFSPCGSAERPRDPAERPAEFDSTWCEQVSDLCAPSTPSRLPNPCDRPPHDASLAGQSS